MALVAYDNSDSSEFEDDDSNNTTVITLNKKVEDLPNSQLISNGIETPSSSEHELDEVSISENGPKLFNLLPQPSKKKPAVVEEDDEFLHKKANTTEAVKPKVKITVPSLNDFRDIEDKPVAAKPKTSNGKKSGLLSILPQPRNAVSISANTLVPNVLKMKPNPVKKKELLPSPMKKAKAESKALVTGYSDESDNDDDVQNDFFSINKPVEELPEDLPVDIDLEVKEPSVSKEKRSLESYFKKDVPEHVEVKTDSEEVYSNNETYYNKTANSEPSFSYSNDYATAESASNEAVLDEEAILKLCGTRGKRKREEIQIVDVNQQEVLANAREMLLKGLMDDTTKRVSASKKRGNEPTSQQKRKHQITYLAHQAKANEAELQNQWSNNRMTKRQTQSKYGF